MKRATVFESGGSQFIRFPSEFHTDEKEFVISKVGNGFFLSPKEDPWRLLKRSIRKMPEDFMEDREQPTWEEVNVREDI